MVDMLLLGKPSFLGNTLEKHQDAHGEISAASFVGAVSLCLAQSPVTK